ncbi:kinase-like domain-containing protein [Mycena sp. CBHHK59/15]|nr:kinase-like domain-containing protein [Mycena sp. CBHHK59/15]
MSCTSLLAGDLTAAFKAPLPLPLAKRVLLHTLRGLAHTHKCGVVHTDLKPDNIFISNIMSPSDIQALIEADPSRRHEAEASYDGIVHAAVSQPIPGPAMEDAMTRTYVLGDFASAQPIGNPRTDMITPASLRPPEIWLGRIWDEKVDIWSFACVAFELVVGARLFVFEPKTVDNVALDDTEYMLYQMMCLTNEDWKAENLQVSPNASKWFDLTCMSFLICLVTFPIYVPGNLKKNPPLYNHNYADIIERYEVVSCADAESLRDLLKRCLRLDPSDRCSAEELLSDPWFRYD